MPTIRAPVRARHDKLYAKLAETLLATVAYLEARSIDDWPRYQG